MSTENKNQVAVLPKDITDNVLNRIKTYQNAGELLLPADYSAENAIRSAQLTLLETKDKDGKPALQVCTKESIANALLKMIVLGLSVMKKQCDFIVRGNQLCCDPEYTGNILLAKRYGKLDDYKPNAIFKGDVFKYEILPNGRRRIIEHNQSFESVGGEVVGAYMWYKLTDGKEDVEIMNIIQIRNAWLQGGAKGNSNAHKNFSDQMAIKTVVNRACKLLIRDSDDAPLMAKGSDNEEPKSDAASESKQEVIAKANAEEIAFEDIPETPQASAEPEPAQQEQQAPAQSTNAQAEIPY